MGMTPAFLGIVEGDKYFFVVQFSLVILKCM